MSGLLDLLAASLAQPQQSDLPATTVDPLTINGPVARGAAVTPIAPQTSGQPVALAPSKGAAASLDTYTPNPGEEQRPQPVPYNYDNTQAVQALQRVNQLNRPADGAGPNPGVYGLLPQNLQHGTLRNILGALGDAFLVNTGHAPYRERMEREQIGNAMAGMNIDDPASVSAAAQRIAATGAPGAPDMSDKIMQQGEQAALRRQYMQYNQDYREQVIGNQRDRIAAQQAAVADRFLPQVGGMMAGVKDPAVYAQKYNSLMGIARQIGGPNATPASLWSLPEPGNWSPELTNNLGITSNQQQISADKAAGRAQTQTNAQINAGARVRGAQISAGRPTTDTLIRGLMQKVDAGQPLSAGEQQVWNHYTQVSHPSRGLPAGVGPSGGGQGQRLTPAQAMKLPKGTHFMGTDGRMYIR